MKPFNLGYTVNLTVITAPQISHQTSKNQSGFGKIFGHLQLATIEMWSEEWQVWKFLVFFWNCPWWSPWILVSETDKTSWKDYCWTPQKLEKDKVSEWLMVGRTALIMKDGLKGRVASNYTPIACLLLICLLIVDEKVYNHHFQNTLLLDKQEGCTKESRDIKYELLIDKAILWNCTRLLDWLQESPCHGATREAKRSSGASATGR